MKRLFILFPTFVIIILSGCITTLHPLATFNTAISDDRIVGSWTGEEQSYTVQKFFNSDLYKKEVSKNNILEKEEVQKAKKDSLLYSKIYIIKYIKEGVKYELAGSIVKLGAQEFINFTVVDANWVNEGDELKFPNRIESNTIARIKFINTNTIKLDFINGEYIYDQVKAGRMKIKNERDDLYDTFLITASTNELQQFIQKYGNDDRFFNKENSVTLIRKS